MPGITGCVSSAPDIEPLFQRMVTSLQRYPWHEAERSIAPDRRAGLAVVRLDTASMSAVTSRDDLIVAFEGELYETDDLRAHLTRLGAHFERGSVTELIAWGVSLEGPGFFARLHGYFAAAVWDAGKSRLTVATDRFGMRSVYWCRAGARLLFASEIRALLQDPVVPRKASTEGLAQLVAFGQFLGDTTLFDAIRTIPAATVLEYDARDERVSLNPYALLVPAPQPEPGGRGLDAVADRLADAVRRTTQESSGLGLSLSGGLDARTILALAPADTPLTTVSLGIPGSIDHRAAEAMSRLTNRPYRPLVLDRGFLGRFEEHLRQMVRLTDGHYLDQGIVMTTLPVYRELGIRTLLRGHAGELMHMRKAYAFSLDAEALTMSSDASLEQWLLKHLTDYMIGSVDGPLLANGSIRDLAGAALRERLAVSKDIAPPLQRIWHLFVAERLRRETALSLHMFRSFVEVRLPYMDHDLVALLLALPPELKLADTLQTHILKRFKPEFLRVVNANTGAPMGAGPLRTQAAYLRMKVFAKLGVPGYQPYERLGLWLSTDLKPLVHRLLLSEQFLGRGLFLPDVVRRVISEHDSRTRNHTFLIMAMMILEIAHQEVFEEPPGASA